MQNKATRSVRHGWFSTEDSDDHPEATSSVASKPTKKRLVDSGADVVARNPLSKRSRKASTSKKARNEEPIDIQFSCREGGLEDEDDQEEWEAIRQCPVKERGVRIFDHVHCRYCSLRNHANKCSPSWKLSRRRR